jgi:hypothetical protein
MWSKYKYYLSISIYIFFIIQFLTGCSEVYSPKPRGYFRIDLPEKQYIRFDSTYPYTFEYPVYAKVVPDNRTTSEPF